MCYFLVPPSRMLLHTPRPAPASQLPVRPLPGRQATLTPPPTQQLPGSPNTSRHSPEVTEARVASLTPSCLHIPHFTGHILDLRMCLESGPCMSCPRSHMRACMYTHTHSWPWALAVACQLVCLRQFLSPHSTSQHLSQVASLFEHFSLRASPEPPPSLYRHGPL